MGVLGMGGGWLGGKGDGLFVGIYGVKSTMEQNNV